MRKFYPMHQKGAKLDFMSRLAIEGETDNFWGQATGVIPVGTGSTGDTQLNVGSKTYFPGDIALIGKAYFVSTVDCDGLVIFNSPTAAATTANASFNRFPLKDNVPFYFEFDQILQPGCQISFSVMNGAGATGRILWGFAATTMTADMNYSSDTDFLVFGDSITRLSANQPLTVKYGDSWTYLVNDYIASLGYDIRVVRKAHGGWSTTDFVNYAKTGWLAHSAANTGIIGIALGTNDALLNLDNAVTTSNVAYLMNYIKKRLPNAPVIFIGQPGLNDNTAEARLVAVRTIISNLVAADNTTLSNGAKRFTYVSMLPAFDRTVLANYNNAGAGPDGIHPIIANHTAMANLVTAHIAANSIKPLI
jgi:lysophospholipase L1-like esterase